MKDSSIYYLSGSEVRVFWGLRVFEGLRGFADLRLQTGFVGVAFGLFEFLGVPRLQLRVLKLGSNILGVPQGLMV